MSFRAYREIFIFKKYNTSYPK